MTIQVSRRREFRCGRRVTTRANLWFPKEAISGLKKHELWIDWNVLIWCVSDNWHASESMFQLESHTIYEANLRDILRYHI